MSRVPALSGESTRLLAAARLLVLDVDGTLTDGSVTYLGDVELARFHVHDGQGLVWLRQAGVELSWISGRGSPAVAKRAAELGVKELHLGVGAKAAVLADVQRRLAIAPAETVAMGDDLVDLAWLAGAALFVAPADARPEVRARAGLVTAARGGAGAVRELCEAWLSAKGLWRERVERASPASPASPASIGEERAARAGE